MKQAQVFIKQKTEIIYVCVCKVHYDVNMYIIVALIKAQLGHFNYILLFHDTVGWLWTCELYFIVEKT
jgi:hypothetical protein